MTSSSISEEELSRSSDVVFNAYESEITITQKDDVKAGSNNLPFMLTSPLMSLRSLTHRSFSRSMSDSQSDIKNESTKKMVKSGDEVEVTRRSLLNMVRASIKSMIESSLSSGHILDSDQPSLKQFFILMENVFQHRLKATKRIFGGNKCFWPALEAIERFHSSASSITESVRSLPGIKTHLGKCRAWLRLALMQKKFADYFQVIVDNKHFFSEWYEGDALLMSDEAAIMLGHLVGLNCLDANLCMKEYDLDNLTTTIDYSLYMKDVEQFMNQCEGVDEESAMQKLVDQKNYLEERNRHLETNVKELRGKVESFESANQLQADELRDLKEQLDVVKRENEAYRCKTAEMVEEHQQILQRCRSDMSAERSSLFQSKAELDVMVARMKEQLKQETAMRLDAEKELEQEMSRRQELEVGLKLQEREIERKQEGLVVLRDQLDAVKATNADLCNQLQVQNRHEEVSSSEVDSMENQTSVLSAQITKLKNELEEANRQTDVAREQAGRYNNQLDDSEKARNVLTTNLQIERDWRQGLEERDKGTQQELTLLREKLEMFASLKEELEKVTGQRDRLLAEKLQT